MKIKIILLALIILSSCTVNRNISISGCSADKNMDNSASMPVGTIPIEATLATSMSIGPMPTMPPEFLNGDAYSKVFSASSNGWYKMATIKSKGFLGKHICAFDIYSFASPQTGVYYGSFFLDLRHGNGKYYGHFYCTNWNKETISGFSPSDLCVTYNCTSNDEATTVIWKKSSSNEDSWFFEAKFVGERVSFSFAENGYGYSENREYVTKKPSIADGYDYVIDVEDMSKK